MLKLDGLTKSAWYTTTIEKNEVRLKVKSITRTDHLKAEKEYTSYKFVDHQRIKVINEEVRDALFRKLLTGVITEWEGIEAECTEENKKLFIDNFAGYIVRVDESEGKEEKISLIQDLQTFSSDISNFILEEKENLVTT